MQFNKLNKASPLATGGAGFHFEAKVQSVFLLSMIVGGEVPCLTDCKIEELIFQAKNSGYFVDDLNVLGIDTNNNKHRLLIQIKQNITFTAGNKEFKEVILAAWKDFNNQELFNINFDSILLVTGSLSKTDTDYEGRLLEVARNSDSALSFFTKIKQEKSFSKQISQRVDIIRTLIEQENGQISDDSLFEFLKIFYICGFDLKLKETITQSLVNTISATSFDNLLPIDVFDRCYRLCDNLNENFGELTFDSKNPEYLALCRYLKSASFIPQEYDENISDPVIDDMVGYTRFILIGGWKENTDKDKELVSEFFNSTYDNVVNQLIKIEFTDKERFIKTNYLWKFIKDKKSWFFVQSTLTETILVEFSKVIVKVLSEISPQYNVPKDKRLFVSFSNTEKLYSQELKKNIIETLTWLYFYKNDFQNINSDTIQYTLNNILLEIFKTNDWKLWASLNEYLPVLAEISPNTFLTLLQQNLVYYKDNIEELFKNEGDGVFGGCLTTGILWALEILAFYNNYLPQVIDLLVLLCSIDPGGNYSNRPKNSLFEIFMPWVNYVQADKDLKIRLLKKISSENPELAADLIIRLLSSVNSFSTPLSKPKLDPQTVNSFNNTVSKETFHSNVNEYTDILTNLVESNKVHLSLLISNFDKFYLEAKMKVVNFIKTNNLSDRLSEEEKYNVWYSLKLVIIEQRKFSDAKWAMPKDTVDELENVLVNYQPTNLLKKYKIFFSEYDNTLFTKEEDNNWTLAREKLNAKKDAALREILDTYGIKIIEKYIDSEVMALNIGFTLSRIIKDDEISQILPEYLFSKNQLLVTMTRNLLFNADNNKNFDNRINYIDWTDEQKLNFFLSLRFEERTWKKVENYPSVKKLYWEQTKILPIQSSSDLNIAIDNFVKCNRYDMVLLSCFAQYFNKEKIKNDILVDALIKNENAIDPYDLEELIGYIQNQNVSDEVKSQIEWKYFAILKQDVNVKPKYLMKQLNGDPKFFNELLNIVYRAENDKQSKQLSENDELVIENAYEVLNKWNIIPGILDGIFDSTYFEKWISEACSLARTNHRLIVAQITLGRVLYYAPTDSSGFWINKSVASILDKPENMKMLDGYHNEVYNSRGAYTVDTTGKADLQISEQWQSRTDDLKKEGFYNFAKETQSLADEYKFESERSKQLKMPGAFTYLVRKDDGENSNE